MNGLADVIASYFGNWDTITIPSWGVRGVEMYIVASFCENWK